MRVKLYIGEGPSGSFISEAEVKRIHDALLSFEIIGKYYAPTWIEAGKLFIIREIVYSYEGDRQTMELTLDETHRTEPFVRLPVNVPVAPLKMAVSPLPERTGFKIEWPADGPAFILCYTCGLKSYNRNDIEQKYCGHCHIFHKQPRRVE